MPSSQDSECLYLGLTQGLEVFKTPTCTWSHWPNKQHLTWILNGSNFGPGSSHFWGWTESLSSTPSLPQRGWPAPVVLWAPHPHWVHILWPKSVDLTMILSLTPPPWMCSRGRATSLGNKCIYFSIMLLPRERVTFFISSETLMPTCTIFWCDYGQGPMLDWDLSLTYWWTLEGKDFK